jgi:hypothetical protein
VCRNRHSQGYITFQNDVPRAAQVVPLIRRFGRATRPPQLAKDSDGGPADFGVSQVDSGDSTAVNTSTGIDCFVRPPEVLDLFDGVEHRRVVAAVIESPDLRQAPAAHALRQIDRS